MTHKEFPSNLKQSLPRIDMPCGPNARPNVFKCIAAPSYLCLPAVGCTESNRWWVGEDSADGTLHFCCAHVVSATVETVQSESCHTWDRQHGWLRAGCTVAKWEFTGSAQRIRSIVCKHTHISVCGNLLQQMYRCSCHLLPHIECNVFTWSGCSACQAAIPCSPSWSHRCKEPLLFLPAPPRLTRFPLGSCQMYQESTETKRISFEVPNANIKQSSWTWAVIKMCSFRVAL